MREISYFAPGPAKIPKEVLESVKDELVHYKDTKVSVMELSHRSQDFAKILQHADSLIRELLKVPSNYKVLFLQGGGTGQFAAVPLNLISKTGKADYIVTGSWSKKAYEEAKKYGEINLVFPKKEPKDALYKIADQAIWKLDPNASYVYYCANETVDGIEFQSIPEVPENIPLVCDMSSNFFSRPVDVSKYGLIYGGAQKNIGCAGVTVVIIREDLIGSALPICPSVLDYTIMAKNNSLYNTPPSFAIHVLGEVLDWVKKCGGIGEMESRSLAKSSLLYSLIDESSGYFSNNVDISCRSRMNVVFRIGGPAGNEALEKLFLEQATQQGLLHLKGHRSVGGIRASIYNALSVHDVTRLATFMRDFWNNNKMSV